MLNSHIPVHNASKGREGYRGSNILRAIWVLSLACMVPMQDGGVYPMRGSYRSTPESTQLTRSSLRGMPCEISRLKETAKLSRV